MKLSLLLIVLYYFVYIVQSDIKSRNKRHRRHHHHRFKSAVSSEQYYGTKLPTFAYDYSQLFLNAIIEQSVDGSLYLIVTMFDHSLLEKDVYPLERIGTDEETLFKWRQAVNKWHSNNSSSSNLRTKAKKGITCVLNNNDPNHLVSYATPASIIHGSESHARRPSEQGRIIANMYSSLHVGFHMIRCRIKGSHKLLSNSSHHHLSVDLINTHQLRTYSKQQKAKNHPNQNSSVLAPFFSSNLTNTVHSEYDVSISLASFSVPWDTRTSGYGFSLTVPNLSTFDPLAEVSLNVSNRLHMCLSTLTDSIWRLTDDRSLFEAVRFVEYYLSIGVSHVFMAVLYDPQSIEMKRIQTVFSTVIASGQLSLLSYSLPGYDEVAGFEGAAVNAAFAETLFSNQCIYYSKGLSERILFMRSRQYLLPTASLPTVSSGNSLGSTGQLLQKLLFNHSTVDKHSTSSPTIIRLLSSASMISTGMFLPTSHVCFWTPNAVIGCGIHSGKKSSSDYISHNFSIITIPSEYAIILDFPLKTRKQMSTASDALDLYMKIEVQSRLDQLQLGTLAQLKKLTSSVIWASLGAPALSKGLESLQPPFWLICGKSESLRDVILRI